MILEALSGKISQLNHRRKNWSPVHSELEKKLTTEQHALAELQQEHGKLVLLSENGDIEAQVHLNPIREKILNCQNRLLDIQAAIEAAKDSEVQSNLIQHKESINKRDAQVKRLTNELIKATEDLDKSFATLSDRHERMMRIISGLIAHTGTSNIQLVELVRKPSINIHRCLASYLPMNSGFEKLDDKPLKLSSLAPNIGQIMKFLDSK